MRLYDHSCGDPALDLAFDEALLLAAEGNALRLWESPAPAVMLGRSSRHLEEVDAELAASLKVPLRRRVSGGATIVTGHGCLMYAVTLDLKDRPALRDLTRAHDHVLAKLVEALRPLEPSVHQAGTSDLAVERPDGVRKFSGNSLRLVRDRLLYHGTLLYDFDLPLIQRLLRTAPRQPSYRHERDHGEFVTNLSATAVELKQRLTSVWRATPTDVPSSLLEAAERLADEKYRTRSWNESR